MTKPRTAEGITRDRPDLAAGRRISDGLALLCFFTIGPLPLAHHLQDNEHESGQALPRMPVW